MQQNEPKQSMSSVEAAALLLSEGKTTNPYLAGILSEEKGSELDMDAMQKAHLRRMMGFDFKIRIEGKRLLVTSKEGPELRTRAQIKQGEIDELGNITSEDLIDRLVDACLRLKTKWDEATAEEAETA